MAFHLGLQKDKKLIALAVILLVLGIAATMLANQCAFFSASCNEPGYNPSIVTHQESL